MFSIIGDIEVPREEADTLSAFDLVEYPPGREMQFDAVIEAQGVSL